MKREEFIKYVKELNININEKQLKQLDYYYNKLTEYNSHTNLTTIIGRDEVYLKHFYDSLTVNKVIDLENYNNLIDIGTGAGFPGMVLKILFPKLKVTLLDSNNKKINFLKEIKSELELKDIDIINCRSEEFALSNLDKFDIVISRAVANLRILTELCLPLVKINGYFIALKSSVDNEIKDAENIINKLNGKIVEKKEFLLPIENSLRNIIVIKKLDKTPKGYPRNYSKIKKDIK